MWMWKEILVHCVQADISPLILWGGGWVGVKWHQTATTLFHVALYVLLATTKKNSSWPPFVSMLSHTAIIIAGPRWTSLSSPYQCLRQNITPRACRDTLLDGMSSQRGFITSIKNEATHHLLWKRTHTAHTHAYFHTATIQFVIWAYQDEHVLTVLIPWLSDSSDIYP